MLKLSFALAFVSIGLLSYAQQKADMAHSTPVSLISQGVTEHLDQFIEPSGIINELTNPLK
ncbi:MAG: hypothetical protein P8P74_11790 [Crocinitomicaceae bacterium]|nr:hypothetical protein [Crocinitomicaceae bacterium]